MLKTCISTSPLVYYFIDNKLFSTSPYGYEDWVDKYCIKVATVIFDEKGKILKCTNDIHLRYIEDMLKDFDSFNENVMHINYEVRYEFSSHLRKTNYFKLVSKPFRFEITRLPKFDDENLVYILMYNVIFKISDISLLTPNYESQYADMIVLGSGHIMKNRLNLDCFNMVHYIMNDKIKSNCIDLTKSKDIKKDIDNHTKTIREYIAVEHLLKTYGVTE